jgi:integrase
VGKFIPRAGEASPVEVFTPEELSALLEAAKRQSPQVYALALQVDDLNLPRRELWVRRTWGSRRKALGEGRFNVPKSGEASRVNMSQQLCRVLRGYLATRGSASSWLFPTAGHLILGPTKRL